MSYSALLISTALAWLTVGVALAVVMGRRGHDRFAWLLVGTVLGPMAIALAVDASRHGEDPRLRVLARARSRGPGPVHVLAGIDGSSESRAAVAAAIDLLGPRMGRLTLATVVPFDGGADNEREARTSLEAAAIALARGPRLEVLRGRPAPALVTHTMIDGYNLLVIGSRGKGASQAVFGSTARELARTSPVPVLMMGGLPPKGKADAQPRSAPLPLTG